MNQYIEFKKQRELGEILSDTFAFMRSQFKPLLSTFFKIVGPYLAVMLVATGFYFYSISSIYNFDVESSNGFFGGLAMAISGFALFVTAILAYSISWSTVLHFIKSYANNKGVTHFEEIKSQVYSSFLSFLGLGFLVVLSIIAGIFACCIPGIYLYVPLVLSFSIMVFNRKEATASYSYSFTLIKDEWWITFASLFVIGIIVGIAGYAFQIPASIYGWMKMGIFSGEVDAESLGNWMVDPVYILLNIISTLAQFLLNIITIVAVVFIYFNLNEKKNFTGTYERIQNLGKSMDE